MTPYTDRLKAGEYDAKKQEKKTAAAPKKGAKK